MVSIDALERELSSSSAPDFTLGIGRLRRIRRIDEARVCWSDSGYLNEYGLSARASKMIPTAWFRVHATRRQALQRVFIESIAVPELPRADTTVAIRSSRCE